MIINCPNNSPSKLALINKRPGLEYSIARYSLVHVWLETGCFTMSHFSQTVSLQTVQDNLGELTEHRFLTLLTEHRFMF